MQKDGWRPSEQEVIRIARELLSVLLYLEQLRPPVVHRDIKPGNVVLEGGKEGGRVYLVDFGGVQVWCVSVMEGCWSRVYPLTTSGLRLGAKGMH